MRSACSYPLLLSILFGLSLSMATAATSAFIADLSARETHGSAMGVLGSVMDIGHTTGPLVSGVVASYFGFGRAFLCASLGHFQRVFWKLCRRSDYFFHRPFERKRIFGKKTLLERPCRKNSPFIGTISDADHFGLSLRVRIPDHHASCHWHEPCKNRRLYPSVLGLRHSCR